MQAGKSLNVYSKKRFGKKRIKYALFEDNYDRFYKLIEKYKSNILRNVFAEERIKDEFANKLLFGIDHQIITDTRKSLVLLNGEYLIFYIMLEKFSESYIQSHYGLPKESVKKGNYQMEKKVNSQHIIISLLNIQQKVLNKKVYLMK